MPESFLRIDDVCRRVALSRSEVYRLVAAGEFPRQYRRSHRIAVWHESELNQWIEEQAEKDRQRGK